MGTFARETFMTPASLNNRFSVGMMRTMRHSRCIVLLALTASACGGSPSAPSIPDCEYYDTGTLILINLAETLTPRDAYVDGRFIAVVPYGNQIVVNPAAGVIHTVEWVSTLGGGTVDFTRLAVDTCSRSTLTNYF
jgi:hypothetical protein